MALTRRGGVMMRPPKKRPGDLTKHRPHGEGLRKIVPHDGSQWEKLCPAGVLRKVRGRHEGFKTI